MNDKKYAYMDQICREVKNILIDRTHEEIHRIFITIRWIRGEEPHIYWEYKGDGDHDVTIAGEEEDR